MYQELIKKYKRLADQTEKDFFRDAYKCIAEQLEERNPITTLRRDWEQWKRWKEEGIAEEEEDLWFINLLRSVLLEMGVEESQLERKQLVLEVVKGVKE